MGVNQELMPRCAGPAIDPKIRAKAKALYVAGATPTQIASECGLNPGTLRVWVTRGNWVAERNVISDKIVNNVIAKVDKITNAEVAQHQKRVQEHTTGFIDRLAKLELPKPRNATEFVAAYKALDDLARRNLGMVDQSNNTTPFNLNFSVNEPSQVFGKTLDVTPEAP